MEHDVEMMFVVWRLSMDLRRAEEAYEQNPNEANMWRLANAAILLTLAVGA